jgi:serine/threonine protein kinase/tetratricopeptide (TPR) repeat protein
MGAVYRVLDTKVNEEIALKLIRSDIASDSSTIQRFRNEMKFTRQIPHRNVCKMYDLGESDGVIYIAMAYVRGEDLKSFIKRSGILTISKAISIAKQVCEGLQEAHSLGVVHRDLKSSNIMIDKEGNARIMDFGIARSLKTKDDTSAGVLFGTPEYMSPEQVETTNVDQRSDIYSFGIILFEMLTGHVPFKGDTPVTLALMHRKETPPNPHDINPEIPGHLNDLILRCLEKDRESRFQSAFDVHKALDDVERGVPITDRIPPVQKTSAKRWGLIALLIALAVIVGISIQFLPKGTPALVSDITKIVVLPFENLGSSEDEYFADGITEEISSRLSALRGLGIISRTSARHYKQSEKTARQVGQELNVDYVLEGTVQWDRSGDGAGRVRVTPQLIQVRDDTQLWSERYDRTLEDIFAVQADIAEQVARQLDLTILAPEREALYAKPTANLEAYNFYLKGKELEYTGWLGSSTPDFELAIDMYDNATSLDPRFALAYTEKSLIHSRLYFFGVDKTNERLAKAKEAADRALELQPDLQETQIALAFYYYWGLLDYDRALEVFESAQKAHPNVSPELKGFIQRRKGMWEESLETLEVAYKLNPRYSQLAYEIGLSYLAMRRYEQANVWVDQVLSINPTRLSPQLGKIAILVSLKGDIQQASALLETLPDHQLTDIMRFTLNMFGRNYQNALSALDTLSFESYEAQNFLFLKHLAYAQVYKAANDFFRMRSHADEARTSLQAALPDHEADPRFHAALGLAYAYLGRKQDAVREGTRAVTLYPVSKDAAMGPIYILNLARIYTIVGEYDKAIEHLEYLSSVPSYEFLWHIVSVPSLKLDPTWDPMRGHPGFQRIIIPDNY